MHVLILEPHRYSSRALEIYRSVGRVCCGRDELQDAESVEVLVVRLGTFIGDDVIASFPRLRLIVSPTTGLDHIDLRSAEMRSVRVISLRDRTDAIDRITSTSEHSLGLLLALLRYIPEAHTSVASEGIWARDLFRGRQLSSLRIGLLGLGRIGGHLASYLRSMGVSVSAHDPYQPQARFESLGVQQVALSELAAGSDVVSIHASLTDETAGLLGHDFISMMKRGALLVNTARGEIVDEAAVVEALRSGQLGGIAVDVLANEQTELLSGSPLVRAAQEGLRVLITPHLGGCTTDAMEITEELMAEMASDMMRDEK